jgi:hypothetical protein
MSDQRASASEVLLEVSKEVAEKPVVMDNGALPGYPAN